MNRKKTNHSSLIQLRASSELKLKIDQFARQKGLTSSTLIRSVMSDYIKKEQALGQIDISFSKKTIIDNLMNNLNRVKPVKKISFNEAYNLINKLEKSS